ncbi:MAG: adenylylsulfate kinase [Clostridiales bacterium]|nr:adenylylsulfate kinase [Clostridiales bacterium]
MPGDKVHIGEQHIQKANVLFPELLPMLVDLLKKNPSKRAVISVCGGSGVGKSEVASILSYYFNNLGLSSYTLSGDNYPHRIPEYNDAERLRIFRSSGLKALLREQKYSEKVASVLQELQKSGEDANKEHTGSHPWLETYINGGKEGLKNYLGTKNEIDFELLGNIVSDFKSGENAIWLKRMGRQEHEIWFEQIDFSEKNILMIEWTHGNSDFLEGVDIPVLLNSTPKETLEHRRARNRDGKTDSAFTMAVLELEQSLLVQQAQKAKLILTKQSEIIDFEHFQMLMIQTKE